MIMLGAVQRTIRGIEINEDSLSIEAMRRVCIGGPNHFLGDEQTMALMQKDYIYPEIADRTSPKEWAEQGSLDILQRAQQRTQEILSQHYPQHIGAALDDKIRAALPIKTAP